MNRRDFGKVSLTGLFSLLLPKEFDMPDQNYSGDYFLKLLRNLYNRAGVSPPTSDFATLGRLVDTERAEYETMRSWLRVVDGRIGGEHLDLPIGVIYSAVLEEDKAELVIEIPPNFSHLLIIGAGRTNGAGTGSDYLTFQFNADTGANYISQKFFAVDTTLTGARDTGQTKGIIGLLAQGGRAAGDVASFFSVIPHYTSNSLNKNSMAYLTSPFGSAYLVAANWDSIAAINKISLTSGADSIAQGSAISVIGLK